MDMALTLIANASASDDSFSVFVGNAVLALLVVLVTLASLSLEGLSTLLSSFEATISLPTLVCLASSIIRRANGA